MALRLAAAARTSARRQFSSTARAERNIGFVGLGQMGFGMASNLRSKLGPDDALHVFDVNPATTARFVAQTAGAARLVEAPSLAAVVAECVRARAPGPRSC